MKRSLYSLIALAVFALGTLAVFVAGMGQHAADPIVAGLMPQHLPVDGLSWLGFGGLVISSANLKTIQTAFNAAFKKGLGTAKPLWQEVALLVPSTTSEEEYGWLGMTTAFREWLGDRVIQNLKTHGYTIKNKTFENTVSVPREKIEDDQYGIFSPLFEQLGQDAALHPDSLVFSALLNGHQQLCYDGQYFFDTDHPVGTEVVASVSNDMGGAGNAWFLLDTSKVIKPVIFQKRRDYNFVAKTALTDDNVFFQNEFVWGSDARVNVGYGLWQLAVRSRQVLDATNYGLAFAQMVGFKSDAGQPLNVKPTVLLVGPSNWDAALKIVQAETLANGATNVYRNTTKVVLCPWLA